MSWDHSSVDEQRQAEAFADAVIRFIDPRAWLNTIVFAIALLTFGVSVWKVFVVMVICYFATRWSFGRRFLTHLAILTMVATVLYWVGLFPTAEQASSFYAAILGRISACVLPAA